MFVSFVWVIFSSFDVVLFSDDDDVVFFFSWTSSVWVDVCFSRIDAWVDVCFFRVDFWIDVCFFRIDFSSSSSFWTIWAFARIAFLIRVVVYCCIFVARSFAFFSWSNSCWSRLNAMRSSRWFDLMRRLFESITFEKYHVVIVNCKVNEKYMIYLDSSKKNNKLIQESRSSSFFLRVSERKKFRKERIENRKFSRQHSLLEKRRRWSKKIERQHRKMNCSKY